MWEEAGMLEGGALAPPLQRLAGAWHTARVQYRAPRCPRGSVACRLPVQALELDAWV